MSQGVDGDVTVEQFLVRRCEAVVDDLRRHGADLIDRLRAECKDGTERVQQLLAASLHPRPLIVTLKCVGGPHIGQRFRLEPADGGEDVFKVGRSTGRHFKERGVSLYKDKEISTTHAKIELRHGQAFLVDVRSTNGTLLNGIRIESAVPFRLREGDVVTFGSTELKVSILEANDENLAPED